MDQNTDYARRPSPIQALFSLLLGLYLLGVALYVLLRIFGVDEGWFLAFVHAYAPYLFAGVLVVLFLGLLMGTRRLVGFALLLLIAGGLWLVPRWFTPVDITSQGVVMPEAVTPDEVGGELLKIVTFNVKPDNDNMDAVIDWLQAQEADVIFLQELNMLGGREALLETMAETYPHQVTSEARPGLVTLSRLQVTEASEFNLANIPQRRVVVRTPTRLVALYNVHLNDPLQETPRIRNVPLLDLISRYDETRRNAQIAQLQALLDDELLPFIVAGDFNLSEYSLVYDDLNAQLGDAYRETTIGLGSTWPAAAFEEFPGTLPPLLRLDYIWHNAEIVAHEVHIGPQLGSDHLPLVGQMVILPLE